MAAAHNPENKPVKIALNLIKADHALQPRVEMDDEHWNRMARAYVEGEDVPPPIHLYFDGKFYWLVDGFHRYKAMWSIRHMGAKFTHIKAIVHNGTKQEAIVFAAQANLDNRSKPMNDMDRKKAMWMLMDLPEWRTKSASTLGKLVSFSSTTAKKHWIGYYAEKGIQPPDVGRDSIGRIVPTSYTDQKSPKPYKRSNRESFEAKIDGQRYQLGSDSDKAKEKLDDIVANQHRRIEQYSSGTPIRNRLLASNINSESIYGNSKNHPGIFGLNVLGVAVTWEPFDSSQAIASAWGRARACKLKIQASRSVVLCIVEKGPHHAIAEARDDGIEFMTVEDFVASLKGDPESNAPAQ